MDTFLFPGLSYRQTDVVLALFGSPATPIADLADEISVPSANARDPERLALSIIAQIRRRKGAEFIIGLPGDRYRLGPLAEGRVERALADYQNKRRPRRRRADLAASEGTGG